MSQRFTVQHRRHPWTHQAKQRGDQKRYQRQQIARRTAERHQAIKTLQVPQARLRQLESQPQSLVSRPKVAVVFLALQLFLGARIGLRAISRVLRLRAWALGMKSAPGPPTSLTWVIRLSIVRIEAARTLKGVPLSP